MIELNLLRHLAFVSLFVYAFVCGLYYEKNPDYSALGVLSMTMYSLGTAVLYFVCAHIIIYSVFSPSTWVFAPDEPRGAPNACRSPARSPARVSVSKPPPKTPRRS